MITILRKRNGAGPYIARGIRLHAQREITTKPCLFRLMTAKELAIYPHGKELRPGECICVKRYPNDSLIF
ncbi:MAG TPA: hypothetical protein VN633_08380 [Bryobacteraceae bacterium]|nr:hypothetical protein [Bryobacteraceae bacterium]